MNVLFLIALILALILIGTYCITSWALAYYGWPAGAIISGIICIFFGYAGAKAIFELMGE